MKLKLVVTKEKRDTIKNALKHGEIEYSDEASFVLYELHQDHETLLVKHQDEYVPIYVKDILYIEAQGNRNLLHTKKGIFPVKETMYQLEADLYEKGFLRIHKAYIVNKKTIDRVKAGLNMKFTLILINGEQIEVSRSYYYHFKEEIGF